MKNFSFSSANRLLACGWEFRDDSEYPPKGGAGDDAMFGSAVHAACLEQPYPDIEAVAKKYDQMPNELLPSVSTLREFLDKLTYENVRYETAYAYDPKKEDCIVLGHHLERDYSGAPEGYLVGTTDYEGIQSGDDPVLVIADVKTGHANNVDAVERNPQLLLGALASATARGWTGRVRLELWFVRPGRVWVEGAEVTLLELWDMAHQIRERIRLLPVLPSSPGEHCKYCPAAGACPSTVEQMGAIVEAGEHGWSTAIVSPTHAAWMAERLPALRKALDAVKSALEKHADETGGIPLPNGKVWRAVPSKRDSLNTKAVKERLGDELGRYMTTTEFVQYRAVKR